MRGYSTWCAVASYFDGDGSVEIEVSKFTIRFKLSFSDNWRDQLQQIKDFLESRGEVCDRLVYAKKGAWHLVVGRIGSVRLAAERMIRSGCVFKKRIELTALLDYFRNKVTGGQVVREFNMSVRAGIRSGYERDSKLPLTYREGHQLQARLAGARARQVHQKVDSALGAVIRDERATQGLSVEKLAKIHKLSKTTISRVLRESFVVPRLGRIGDQETLD